MKRPGFRSLALPTFVITCVCVCVSVCVCPAIEAAIQARQWSKAGQIVDMQVLRPLSICCHVAAASGHHARLAVCVCVCVSCMWS